MSEEEKEKILQRETAEFEFKEQRQSVQATAKSVGFKIIMDLIVAEMEYDYFKLRECSEKDLKPLQERIRIRKDFLDKWSVFLENLE